MVDLQGNTTPRTEEEQRMHPDILRLPRLRWENKELCPKIEEEKEEEEEEEKKEELKEEEKIEFVDDSE